MKTTKLIRVAIGVLMIVGLCGFVIIDGAYALDGEALGGECGICGRWIPAGKQCPCWQQTAPQPGIPGGYQLPGSTGPSPEELAELERQRKRRKATELNKTGIEYWNKQNWQKAAEYFRKALQFNPTNKTIQDNLHKAEEIVAREKWLKFEKEEKKRRLDEAKEKMGRIVDNLNLDFDGSSGSSTLTFSSSSQSSAASAPLEFIDPNEPLFSKGNKYSAPVNLDFADLNKPVLLEPAKSKKSTAQQKGLRIKEVPKPSGPKPKWDPYSAATRTEIILDALQHGKGDWDKNIEYLENYLRVENPHNVKVKQALSYIEGLRAGAIGAEDIQTQKKDLFAPTADDSKWLLEAITGQRTYIWPGSKNPASGAVGANPLDWKVQRTQLVLEALQKGKGDWQESIRYLEEKAQEESAEAYTAAQALQYVVGFHAYYRKLTESK